MRKYWTEEETEELIKNYSDVLTTELSKRFNCDPKQIYNKAKRLNLHKSPAYLKKYGGQFIYSNVATQFKKGQPAWNKGKKGLQIGGVKTQFKLGRLPHNTKPIGFRSYRDGYLVEKTATGFEFVHKLLWIEHNGPIPPGMFVVFKDRNRANICIENLEVITRVEHIMRNHIQNLPAELKEVIHLKSSLTRKINQHGTKQN